MFTFLANDYEAKFRQIAFSESVRISHGQHLPPKFFLISAFRACLHGGGGPQVGEVARLAVVEKWLAFTCKLTTPGSRSDVTRHCYVVARHVNRENGDKRLILAVSVLFLSLSALAATFQCRGFLLLLLMNVARFGALANLT